MQTSNVYEWIKQEERRRQILTAIHQPLTAAQIARKTGIPTDTCSWIINRFTAEGLTLCLNPQARNSRVYGLTEFGIRCRNKLQKDLNLPQHDYEIPSINWALYGWLCFSHRSTVIRILTEPMQPSEMKRKLRRRNANVKISANNIRDVIQLLLQNGIVTPVKIKKKAHLHYELTPQGLQLREILIQAENPLWHNSSTIK